MRHFGAALLAAAVAGVLLVTLSLLFADSPATLLRSFVAGSIGSRFAWEATLLKTTPLLLTGISVALAFRAGVWNIGAEGQFIVGGVAACLAAPAGSVAALGAAIAGGAVWSLIAALLRIRRDAPEVLTTILLNFVAFHLLGYAVNGPLQESAKQYPQSDAVPATLSILGGSRIHSGLPLALLVAIAAWLFLYRTTAGLQLRATGLNASAARWGGIRTDFELFRAMALSGGVAGLAGGVELLGLTHRLFERFATGYGYAGITVALLAHLDPLACIASALFLGALTTGAGELQRGEGISASVAVIAQAVMIVVLLIAARRRADD